MIGIYLAPLYLLFIIVQLTKKKRYFNEHPSKTYRLVGFIISTLILFVFPACVIVGYLIPTSGTLKYVLTTIGNSWLGFSMYFFSAIIFCDFIRLICRLILKDKYNVHIARTIANLFTVIFSVVITIYGSVHAYDIKYTNYTVYSNKESSKTYMRIALVADLHLGYNVGTSQINDMVEKINKLQPDIVIMAGDIFDNEYAAIDNPEEIINSLKSIKSTYGNYLVLGNHDTEEKRFVGFTFNNGKKNATASNEMLSFIEQSGFKLLYDESINIHDENGQTICILYGRPDKHRINLGNTSRKEAYEISAKLDDTKYIICLDHEPYGLLDLENAGIDLLLSGHTHGGQIWPANYLTAILSDNSYGKKEVGDMVSIVTSGIGTFGPHMRVGTNSEIVNINVNFIAQ